MSLSAQLRDVRGCGHGDERNGVDGTLSDSMGSLVLDGLAARAAVCCSCRSCCRRWRRRGPRRAAHVAVRRVTAA